MAKIKTAQVPVSELVPYSRNARTHSAAQIEQLRSSIREFGFINPILIDGDKGIIAGHGRVEAAKLEGLEAVPCVYVEHLTEAQKRAYIIADNKLAESAGWDFEQLTSELIEIRQGGLLETIGFTERDLERLLGGQEEAIESGGEDGDEPESSAEEINTEAMKFKHRCPKCGFEYD